MFSVASQLGVKFYLMQDLLFFFFLNMNWIHGFSHLCDVLKAVSSNPILLMYILTLSCSLNGSPFNTISSCRSFESLMLLLLFNNKCL